MTDWLPALAVAGSLAGVWLGQVMSRRSRAFELEVAREAKVRDERLEAYHGHLALATEFDAVLDQFTAEYAQLGRDAATDALRARIGEEEIARMTANGEATERLDRAPLLANADVSDAKLLLSRCQAAAAKVKIVGPERAVVASDELARAQRAWLLALERDDPQATQKERADAQIRVRTLDSVFRACLDGPHAATTD